VRAIPAHFVRLLRCVYALPVLHGIHDIPNRVDKPTK
jgi:hypothetical protein